MTWSEFTSYLDGSRPLRKAERDELYDNLDELLTGDCEDAGYSLNATAQTAIKASRLRTDLASLDGPGATNTTGRLHAVLEEASEAFVNYDDAVADALSAEGLTSTDRDAIISARLDDWRLWNYYRRVIDALECCTVPVINNQIADAESGVSFSYSVVSTGSSPKTFSASGLPSGLTINSSTGVISGTPTGYGTSYVTVTVANACGEDDAVVTINVEETCNFPGEDASGSYSGPVVGAVECYNQTFNVSGYFVATANLVLSWVNYVGSLAFEVRANGSLVLGTGCRVAGTGAGEGGNVFAESFAVPAGTTSLQVIITCDCENEGSGADYAWEIACALPP